MIKLLRVRDQYIGAALDEKGNPVKIVADVLEVSHYVIDSETSPMSNLVVTFARVDPSNGFVKAGPVTQHLITGLELIEVLEQRPITIDTIEASTLKTGIPGAGIKPGDLAPYEPPSSQPDWAGRLIEDTRRKMAAMAEVPPPPIATPLMQPASPLTEDDAQ